MTEHVLYTEWDPDFEGFQTVNNEDAPFSIDGAAPEEECEKNPDVLELITYSVVFRVNRAWLDDPSADKGAPEVLVGQRQEAASEDRLRGDYTFGWGGNLNEADEAAGGSLVPALEQGTIRELKEELLLPPEGFAQFSGLLCDPSDDVGQDHLGLVMAAFADQAMVREQDKYGEGRWIDLVPDGPWHVDEADNVVGPFESWSELLVPHLQDIANINDLYHPGGWP